MPTPTSRSKILPARGSKANLDAALTAGDLLEGELCYAKDEDALYQVEGGVLVKAGGGLQPGDNVSELTNDAGYITAADIPAVPVTSVAGKTGDVVLVKADITDFSDADYATAAQGATADSATQPGDNVSTLTNDAGYVTEAPQDGTQYVRNNAAWEAVDVPPGTVVSNVAPVAPDNGQLWYDTEDARIFVWTGTEWADASPDAGNPTVITSDSAPAAPQDGDLWFRTSDGRMYVYYDDGASSQWVDANPATGASNWNYDGTTLTPGTAGTDVDLGTGDLSTTNATLTGDLSAAVGTFGSGNITLNANGSGVFKGNVIVDKPAVNKAFITQLSGVEKASISSDGSATFGSGNITLNADGSATFALSVASTRGNGDCFYAGPNTPGAYDGACFIGDLSSKDAATATFFAGNFNGNRAFEVLKDGTTKIGGTLPNSPNITIHSTGLITSLPTFNYDPPGSTRTLICNTSGIFGCSPSVRAAKTNITSVEDTSWIKGLNVVKFNRRRKDDDGNYTSEFYEEVNYGLIAEEVEEVNPELVDYNADGTKFGVRYDQLAPLLLKELQTALTRIEALESANAALEARLSTLEGN